MRGSIYNCNLKNAAHALLSVRGLICSYKLQKTGYLQLKFPKKNKEELLAVVIYKKTQARVVLSLVGLLALVMYKKRGVCSCNLSKTGRSNLQMQSTEK